MIAHVHSECVAVGNEVFSLAGSNVLYNDSSLQRRFRDLRSACQFDGRSVGNRRNF